MNNRANNIAHDSLHIIEVLNVRLIRFLILKGVPSMKNKSQFSRFIGLIQRESLALVNQNPLDCSWSSFLTLLSLLDLVFLLNFKNPSLNLAGCTLSFVSLPKNYNNGIRRSLETHAVFLSLHVSHKLHNHLRP